jgi:bacillopeptidase F (M6 metalloprotease family)
VASTPTATATGTRTATPTATQAASPTSTPGAVLPQVRNGDFELGGNGDWTESSTNGYALILNTAPIAPRSGEYLAWLGGADNETSDLSQTFVLPASGPIYLHFYYQLGSGETSCSFDLAGVMVNAALEWQSGLCQANNTGGWTKGAIDLSGYAGQTVTIHFKAVTDSSVVSSFLVDDVSFQATP